MRTKNVNLAETAINGVLSLYRPYMRQGLRLRVTTENGGVSVEVKPLSRSWVVVSVARTAETFRRAVHLVRQRAAGGVYERAAGLTALWTLTGFGALSQGT